MISRLQKAVDNPRIIGIKGNRSFYNRYGNEFNEHGVNVFDADWDNLIILDACRDDTFRGVTNFPGITTTVTSRGSMTREWVRANIAGRDLSDVVYIAANNWYLQSQDYPTTGVHDYINLQEEQFWDDDEMVCLPETVAKQALKAAERYPNKRLLIHFVQPHVPFIRDARRLLGDPPRNVYNAIIDGEYNVDRGKLREAYRQNLREALPSVKDLVNGLRGKTVISSDHGEMLGERARPFPIREWGHPPGMYYPQLVRVPWHEFPVEERRETVKEKPRTRRFSFDEAEVRKRLQDLGYL